jgi:hypothetical protein
MGKGSGAAKGDGVVAIENLKVMKFGRSTVELPGTLGDPWKVRNSHEPVLAGECKRPIGTLRQRDTENPMGSRIVYREGALVVDHQAAQVSGKAAYRRSFCAPTAPGFFQSGGPPVLSPGL